MEVIKEQLESIPDYILKNLIAKIEDPINNAGIFSRVFGRIKSFSSFKKKCEIKQYNSEKKLQDLFGVRVTVYFKDDVKICKDIVQNTFDIIDTSIDKEKAETFEPSRLNIVCRLPSDIRKELDNVLFESVIDETFEIQIRTVFSEGWHEVEHDLRYKCKDEWADEIASARTLNGIYATLVTCDWAMIKLFDDRAYAKYKNEDWESMIKSKFRIRFTTSKITDESLIRKDLMKEVFKLNREPVIMNLSLFRIPLEMNNFLHIVNALFIHQDGINTPPLIKKMISKNQIDPKE